jgi:hypothetical protein
MMRGIKCGDEDRHLWICMASAFFPMRRMAIGFGSSLDTYTCWPGTCVQEHLNAWYKHRTEMAKFQVITASLISPAVMPGI